MRRGAAESAVPNAAETSETARPKKTEEAEKAEKDLADAVHDAQPEGAVREVRLLGLPRDDT